MLINGRDSGREVKPPVTPGLRPSLEERKVAALELIAAAMAVQAGILTPEGARASTEPQFVVKTDGNGNVEAIERVR